MGLEHSFTNYVKEKYYNELFEALQDFITDQVENLELRLNVVEEIDEVNLSDIEIKQIYIEDLPGTKIDFDILLEAHIEVSDINKRLVDDQEIAYQWFHYECTINLDTHFKNFVIKHIDIYNQGKNRKKSKMDYLNISYPLFIKKT